MTGLIVLVALVIAIVAALELSRRRDPRQFPAESGWQGVEDRDVARTRLDLLALAGRAEPFAHKPFTVERRAPRHATSPAS